MALDTSGILDAIVSHAAASGYFEQVRPTEKYSPPGNGLNASVWSDGLDPVRTSGLTSVSARLNAMVRIETSLEQEPAEEIDNGLHAAVDALFTAYCGDFQLGGRARQIDIFGQHGRALSAENGYIHIGDHTYRVSHITVPVIINDLWDQSP